MAWFLFDDRMIKLDSRAPREELLKLASKAEAGEEEMEDGGAVSVTSLSAKILDRLMALLFEYSAKRCQSEWTEQRTFFNELYASFVSLVLPTMGVHHTHFLMLYVCSTKPTLTDCFVERLWTLFQTPSTSITLRKSAADYLASFLGKAKFVPMK